MSDIAVEVKDVSKRFRLAHGRYNSLKERIIHGGRTPTEDFWALKNVALQVREGETVGILGRNGSGKSTLLKCICGVLQPTSGEVVVRGKLAGLLELGAGFQQDLTGRENIYLNGSLLGMSKKEVDRVFDAIVDFSELEEFIDGAVKFYSSGMYVRLGFAVAVNVDPDILVIDEVLAVGDERFQRKCIDRVKAFQKEGRTILLVTHSPDQVRSICDRAIVLSHGDVVSEALPGRGGARLPRGTPGREREAGRLRRSARGAADQGGAGSRQRSPRADHLCDPLVPEVRRGGLSLDGRTADHRRGLSRLDRHGGRRVLPGAARRGRQLLHEDRQRNSGRALRSSRSGPGWSISDLDDIPLLDGTFSFSVGILSKGGVLFDWREPAGHFDVMCPTKATGFITMPVRAVLGPPQREGLAMMAPEELAHLEAQA